MGSALSAGKFLLCYAMPCYALLATTEVFLICELIRRIYFLKSTILVNYGQLEPKWRTEVLEIDGE